MPKKMVVLSCLHTLQFDAPMPKIGEHVFCPSCNAYRRSVIPPDSYRIECRDCTRPPRSDYGTARIRAELDADKHARKLPGHRTLVYNGGELVSERMHGAPASLLDAPPY